MPDLKTVEKTVGDILVSITGLDKKNVIVAFSRFGRPISSPCENIVAFWVEFNNDANSEVTNFINRSYDRFGVCHYYSTESFKLHFQFYGPDSFDLASKLTLEWYRYDVKEKLQGIEVYTIPSENEGPTRLMENKNGQWFDRCDVAVSVYALHELQNQVGTYEDIGPLYLTNGKIEIIKEE